MNEDLKPKAEPAAMFQQQTHIDARAGRTWFVSDLPGCAGTRKLTGAEAGSDFGFTTDRAKALALSPYWQRRFIAYCKRDRSRPFGFA